MKLFCSLLHSIQLDFVYMKNRPFTCTKVDNLILVYKVDDLLAWKQIIHLHKVIFTGMKVDDSGFFKYKKYMICWYESRLTCDKYEYSLYDSRLFNCLTADHLSSSCMEADWSFTHFSHQKDHSPSSCLKLDNSLPFFQINRINSSVPVWKKTIIVWR